MPKRQLIGPAVVPSERVVVGTCLYDARYWPEFCAGLPPEAFTDVICQAIWREMAACQAGGIPWTRYILAQRLATAATHGGLKLGPAEVCDFPSHCACTEQALPLEVQAVRDAWIVRRLQAAGAEMGEDWRPGMPPGDALSRSSESLAALEELLRQETASDIRTVLETLIVSMQSGRAGKGIYPGVLPRFEELVGGYQPACLYIFGARPSVGKTALVVSLAVGFANQGAAVLLISTESTKEIMTLRCLGHLTGIDAYDVRRGRVAAADLADARGRMPPTIEVDDSSRQLPDILLALRAWRRSHFGPAVIMVDYLELIASRGENREQELSRIVIGLQAAAKALAVPVVLLSQLARRAAEKEDGPALTDFRGSGMIEQAADVAALLWRSKPKADGPIYDVKMYVGKNRIGGSTFTLDCSVERSRSKIMEVTHG